VRRLFGFGFLLTAALCFVGCIWAIGAGREELGAALGFAALLTAVCAWLIVLPAALSRP
jgi:hypothetical protein